MIDWTVREGRLRRWLPVLLVSACAPEVPPDGDGDADLRTCAGGDDFAVLVTELTVGRAVDGVSDGFDLDGEASSAGGLSGCGVADLVAPDGTPGIDNAFANLIPVLESTEALALEPLVQTAINAGGMMVLFRWSGVDDPLDDDCVTVESLGGTGPVFLGPEERLLPQQTVDVDPAIPVSVDGSGTLTDGVLEAGPLEVVVSVEVLRAKMDMPLRDARLRLTPDGEGGYEGIVAGGIAIDAIMAIADIPEVDDVVGALIGPLLAPLADLDPDGTGTCTHLSMTGRIKAVPVFLFDEAEVP